MLKFQQFYGGGQGGTKLLDTEFKKSKNPATDVEITAKNRFKPEQQNRNMPKNPFWQF